MNNNLKEMLVDAKAYHEAVEELMDNINLEAMEEGLERLRAFYQTAEAINTEPSDLYSDYIVKKFLNLYRAIGDFLENTGKLEDALYVVDENKFLADDMESDLDV